MLNLERGSKSLGISRATLFRKSKPTVLNNKVQYQIEIKYQFDTVFVTK